MTTGMLHNLDTLLVATRMNPAGSYHSFVSLSVTLSKLRVSSFRKNVRLDWRNNKHRAYRHSHYALGNASQKQMPESGASAAVCAHYNQVDIEVLRHRSDLSGRESTASKTL